ncbi:hypothetical protein BXZ70DRAFT_907591 [Cristinia sonorae]|uniref:Uncharacterized protein n=1 Tax=Cristinia sonorae TaxID=1940300 RepID=A0A8K0UMC6_9AGAR|nr:hypothetical protein BXZ70DRAFT_907591 [Cristinia sonorae]
MSQSPTLARQPSFSRLVRQKSSKASLRDAAAAAATPLSRLRNKFFAVKATQNESGTEVDVLEISDRDPEAEDMSLVSSPDRSNSMRLKFKESGSGAASSRTDEYLRKALQSASLKRSNTLPYTPPPPSSYSPPPQMLRTSYSDKPLPPSPGSSSNTMALTKVSRSSNTTTNGSTRFILAVDPDWDPAVGEATLFIFPQDEQDLHGGIDRITLEEIWNGFFPGVEMGSWG